MRKNSMCAGCQQRDPSTCKALRPSIDFQSRICLVHGAFRLFHIEQPKLSEP